MIGLGCYCIQQDFETPHLSQFALILHCYQSLGPSCLLHLSSLILYTDCIFMPCPLEDFSPKHPRESYNATSPDVQFHSKTNRNMDHLKRQAQMQINIKLPSAAIRRPIE
jgi:hypothetical protein